MPANTDPDYFTNGCSFEVNRDNKKQHLSFGNGIHFCIGAPLARLQIKEALVSIINQTQKIEIDESKPLNMVVNRDNGILRYEQIWLKL